MTNSRPASHKGERLSGEPGSVSGEPVMMEVIMQKCDDTHNVAADDRTILPLERGALFANTTKLDYYAFWI